MVLMSEQRTMLLQGKQSQSSLQYDRLQALDSPALRAGNWGQLCVTCKVRATADPARNLACVMVLKCTCSLPLVS